MGHGLSSVVKTVEGSPREGWDDAERGDATWFTFFSSDLTPTTRMCAGTMEIPPRGPGLLPHRHEQPEIYYVVAGKGVVRVDGIETDVAPGSAVFIQGRAEHGVRNTGDSVLRIFYVFPADRFSEVNYEFPTTTTGESPPSDV